MEMLSYSLCVDAVTGEMNALLRHRSTFFTNTGDLGFAQTSMWTNDSFILKDLFRSNSQ
jgi:hypothetical protein